MYHSLALVNNVKLVLQRVYLASPNFSAMQQGFQDITSNPLKGAIWCCKIHEHLWSEIGEDKGEKRVSITKILADILSEIFYARPPLPPVSRLVNCNIWSEREREREEFHHQTLSPSHSTLSPSPPPPQK